MKTLKQIIGWLGLGLTIVPSLLVFMGTMSFGDHTLWMFIGLLLWFGRTLIPVAEEQEV